MSGPSANGPRVVVVDNYDSFVYNLVQYLWELGAEVVVYRNDAVPVEKIAGVSPTHVVLSPGPGIPGLSGINVELIRRIGPAVPVLGVCLGHQAIGLAYGARVVRADVVVHGKSSLIYHDGLGVYAGLENPFPAARYHSLVVDRDSLPPELVVTAETGDGVIMGLRHGCHPVEGVQFHPESVLTGLGRTLLKNFLNGGGREGR